MHKPICLQSVEGIKRNSFEDMRKTGEALNSVDLSYRNRSFTLCIGCEKCLRPSQKLLQILFISLRIFGGGEWNVKLLVYIQLPITLMYEQNQFQC